MPTGRPRHANRPAATAVAAAVLSVLLLMATPAVAKEPARYWAMWSDGATLTAATLEGTWFNDDAKLAGRRLFDAKPVRILCDLDREPGAATSRVLMANGDVLPGHVARYVAAAPDGDMPAALFVVPELPLFASESGGVWVRADRVLRIIAAKADAPASEPGTLVFADGRRVSAGTVRWSEQGVRALTEAGIITAAFVELADLYLPKVDVMTAVCEDSQFPPIAEGLIARLQTTGGASLTWRRAMTFVSQQTIQRKARDRTTETRTFVHIQPAWALSSLMVPVETVASVSFRRPDELPLSHLPAEVLQQRSGIHAWPWQRDRSVRGEMLRSGQMTADLGLGTHSYLALAFELPPGARQFTGLVGIDATVGSGGCASCKLFADRPGGKPLFASGFLRGGEEPVRVGPIELNTAQRLVLETDFAHQNRPSGAYPFDIGDHVNWLFPMVAYTPPPAEVSTLVRRFVTGWERWQMDEALARRLRLTPLWDDSVGRWAAEVHFTGKGPVELTRTVAVKPLANDLLEVVVSPDSRDLAVRIELLVDGQPQPTCVEELHTFSYRREAAIREKRDHGRGAPSVPFRGTVLRWDLHEFAGREPTLTLRIAGEKDAPPIFWHAVRFRQVVGNLPPDGLLAPDVPLSRLEAKNATASISYAKPLPNRIPKPSKRDEAIRFLGRTFEEGYGLAGRSAVSFDVKPEYKRFVAIVGCCVERAGPMQVLLDDEVAWESGVFEPNSPAAAMSVEIPPGVKTLTLKMLDSKSGYTAGAFANAGFMTE